MSPPGEGFASWAERERAVAEASARWTSDRCPACHFRGLAEDTASVGGQEITTFMCTNAWCRATRYFGPRAADDVAR